MQVLLDDERYEVVRDTEGSWGDVLVSFERTKAVFVMGAGVILVGVVAIWWYLKRLNSD